MRLQSLFAMLFTLISFLGFGQNVASGEVMAVIPLGAQSYSVIHEDGTENYYKTSIHPSGELLQGQPVDLRFNTVGNVNTIEVISASLSDPLFCELISQNSTNSAMMPLLRGIDIGYRRHVGYNTDHNVLVFQTWNDVRALELLIEESVNNYPYNQGNEVAIFDVMDVIRRYGWTTSPNQTGNEVSLPQFKEFLDISYPLSSNVLIALIELDEERALDPDFMRDVFSANLPLSYNTEQRLISSRMEPTLINRILDDNDNFLDAPNHAYLDFIATFPGYSSLYEKLNTEQLSKLQSGMDPEDPNYDSDPVIIPFERLIMNDKYEVWIEGKLYKLYEQCRAIAMQGSVEHAYEDLAVLNPDGSPDIPQLSEGPQGVSQQVMDGYIPSGYMVYNPQEFDPLVNVGDDPHFETALQTYNFITGCPVSNYTYSLYTTSDLTVDFYNMTDFSDVIQPENSFYHYWTFGDGTGSFQNNPVHTFGSYGTYTVRLTTFNADCGCWSVHKYVIDVVAPQLREGNPDCPIKTVVPEINWAQDSKQAYVNVEPGTPTVSVPPITHVVNYHFAFYDSQDNIVHEVNNGSQGWIYYTFAEAGEYYVIVTLTWNQGCISESDQHPITVIDPEGDPECCDKKDRNEDKKFYTTYNDDDYKLCIKDLARGSFGTASWRKMQGTQELYVKKENNIFWKKQPARHDVEVYSQYYKRIFTTDEGMVCVAEEITLGSTTVYQPYEFQSYSPNCGSESFSAMTLVGNSGDFKFGLFEGSMVVDHKVYLGGSMIPATTTPHCCDCTNSGGHLLFNQQILLGECDD